jgi:hypothetical protein
VKSIYPDFCDRPVPVIIKIPYEEKENFMAGKLVSK